MTNTHDDDRTFVPPPPYRPATRHPREIAIMERISQGYAFAYSAACLMGLQMRAAASWVKRNPENTLSLAGAIMAIIMTIALLWPRGGPLP